MFTRLFLLFSFVMRGDGFENNSVINKDNQYFSHFHILDIEAIWPLADPAKTPFGLWWIQPNAIWPLADPAKDLNCPWADSADSAKGPIFPLADPAKGPICLVADPAKGRLAVGFYKTKEINTLVIFTFWTFPGPAFS
jgi:hypothetical protein